MSDWGHEVVSALERGPLTLSEIALETGFSVRAVQNYLYVLNKEPKRVHVADWERSEVQDKLVKVYAAGPGIDMSLGRYLSINGLLGDTMQAKVIRELSVKPMTVRQLIAKLGANESTVKNAVTKLRHDPRKVCVAKYQASPEARVWVKVFGLGETDARYPIQKRPAIRVKPAPAALLAKAAPVVAQSWMSALGGL